MCLATSGGSRVGGRARHRALLVCFFSSRRRHTRFDCDWSSDVCSSDLEITPAASMLIARFWPGPLTIILPASPLLPDGLDRKSVGVGKECRSRWSPYH